MSTNPNDLNLLKEKEFQTESQKIEKSLGKEGLEREINKRQDTFLEAMEDDDKATIYIAQKEQEKQQKAKDQREKAMDYVDFYKGDPSHYRANLAEWGMWRLMQIEWPIGWHSHCVPTKKGTMHIYTKTFDTKDGVIVVLKSPKGEVYVKAMYCSYDPLIDVFALSNLVVMAENTLDSYEGKLLAEKRDSLDELISRERQKGTILS